MIHDQSSDRSFRVFASKLREFGPEARDLVKEASVDYEELDALPDTAFAWPEERKYPIHSPEHTALSMIYAHGEAVPSHVEESLVKAAEVYELELPTLEKQASETAEDLNDYLIPQRRFGRIAEKGHVKEAQEFFRNNHKKMDLLTRTHAATTLVKKARVYGEELPVSVYQRAGMTEVDLPKLAEWCEVRSNLTTDERVKGAFTKMASYVSNKKKMVYASRNDMIKIADTLATLDRKAGLEKRYDQTLPDPMMTVFNTEKLAEESVTLANRSVPMSKLLGVPVETYGDILGDDLVPEIKDTNGGIRADALLDVLKTLPADLQVVLVKTLGL